MKITSLLCRYFVAGFLFIMATVAIASEVKFSIIPIVRAPTTMPANGLVYIQYKVTNNTAITRELNIVPIPGVHLFVTGATGGCHSPFVLASGQSCLMTLQLIGHEMGLGGVQSGPVVCRTLGSGDHRPDALFCSQPSPADMIQVSLNAVVPVTLIPSLNSLTFNTGKVGLMTLTNLSSVGFAQNLNVHFIVNTGISVISSTCPVHLPPGMTCSLGFTSATPAVTTLSIMGTNSNQLLIPIAAVNMPLKAPVNSLIQGSNGFPDDLNLSSITTSSQRSPSLALEKSDADPAATIPIQASTPTPTVNEAGSEIPVAINLNRKTLTVTAGGAIETVVVTNTSATTPALNIAPFVPLGSSISFVNNCPVRLGPTLSCTIDFRGTEEETDSIPIAGSNTNAPKEAIRVVTAPTLSVSPSLGVINTDGIPTQFTVTNTSSTTDGAYATNVQMNLPASWAPFVTQVPEPNCSNLAPGAQCQISLSTNKPFLAQNGIAVTGSNTSPTSIPTVAIAFQSGGGLVFDINSSTGITTVAALTDSNPPSSGLAWQTPPPESPAISSADGAANTNTILQSTPSAPPALVCDQFISADGSQGWFLPAKDQLIAMYNHLFNLGFGNFSTGTPASTLYWSSTEDSAYPEKSAFWVNFVSEGGLAQSDSKTLALRVRCARSF